MSSPKIKTYDLINDINENLNFLSRANFNVLVQSSILTLATKAYRNKKKQTIVKTPTKKVPAPKKVAVVKKPETPKKVETPKTKFVVVAKDSIKKKLESSLVIDTKTAKKIKFQTIGTTKAAIPKPIIGEKSDAKTGIVILKPKDLMVATSSKGEELKLLERIDKKRLMSLGNDKYTTAEIKEFARDIGLNVGNRDVMKQNLLQRIESVNL